MRFSPRTGRDRSHFSREKHLRRMYARIPKTRPSKTNVFHGIVALTADFHDHPSMLSRYGFAGECKF
jgi:hypothetical protein